jgi:hypothetical protein
MRRFGLILLLLPLLGACKYITFSSKENVVAEIDHHQLLASEISGLIAPGLPREDSLALLRQYVNSWALSLLMEKRAEKELPKEEKDVHQALEEYRRSLLVFRYEKNYLEQRIDTLITEAERRNFFQGNQDIFLLKEPIAKARYIKVSKSSPYLETLRSLYKTRSIEEGYQLEQLAQNATEKYETFQDQWISASQLARDLPLQTDACIEAMKKGYFECADNYSHHLVMVFEQMPAGVPAPQEYEEANIRNMILAKRKQELLRKLEQEVLQDGWQTQQLKVYFDQNE